MSARVAQSVEQRPEKPRVGGSIPSPRTIQIYPKISLILELSLAGIMVTAARR